MDSHTAQLTFYGGAGTVTGANFLLERIPVSVRKDISGEESGTKILIDCGLLQDRHFAPEVNRTAFPYDPKEIQALLVTHAHMDHIGRIPKLVRDGFIGTIYGTPATGELAEIMYADSLKIMEEEAHETGVVPLYDARDVQKTLVLWKNVPYHTKTDVGGGFGFSFKDAGHILGSAIIEVFVSGSDSKIVFTGDLGNSPAPLLQDTETVADADYLIMESVYGDRNHEPKDERDRKLRECIIRAITRGGTLMIPSFSIERTQVLLYELNNLIEDGKMPSVPVFLDSPLAIAATGIYRRRIDAFNEGIQEEIKGGDNIFQFPRLTMTGTIEESKSINDVPEPKIVIAGAGMLTGGRILHHARRYLPDPQSTLLLVGFQAPGTLGRRIEDGVKEVTIFDKTIQVRASVENIRGYSAHKDSDHLVEFVSHTASRVKRVFVAMGEPKASAFLAQRLRDCLDVNAVVPDFGDSFRLDR